MATTQPLTLTTSTSTTSSTTSTTRPRASSNVGPALLVRALYDYNTSDTTNLSFKTGDLIRVLTQLQSGWWDGCIDNERGWFPCNFVTPVDIESLEDDDGDGYGGDLDEFSGDDDLGEMGLLAGSTMEGEEEYQWVLHADEEGRTFYVNTSTGTTSWELPGTRVFLEDWDETRLSDDDAPADARSSVDSENSGEILMLGPSQPEFNVPDPLSYYGYQLLLVCFCDADHSDYLSIRIHHDIHHMQRQTP